MLLEKRAVKTQQRIVKYKNEIDNNNIEQKAEFGNFYWSAARNCVQFYLSNSRQCVNKPKYQSFETFLSLPHAQARKTNVWRWYFRTGGHPPYDPNKRY